MNLLYFSCGYSIHDRRFLEAFVEAGHQVSYLRLLCQPLDARALPLGVNPIRWIGDERPLRKVTDYFVLVKALRSIVANLLPQAIIAGPVQTCAFLVALAGCHPLVTMSWGSDLLMEADRNLWMRTVTKHTMHHSQGAFGDCQAVHDKICEFSPLTDDRIVTFPWGIDLRHFFAHSSSLSLRRDLGWMDNPVVISTRSWEPVYAVDVLLRAFVSVHRQSPKVRLLLLGDGSQAPIIKGLISDLGLADIIFTPGRISYDLLSEYYCTADIYVSSALSDGTSVSLLEAMACGLPVVVSRGHGNLEWVDHRKNGWLVTPDDSDSLAEALLEALAEPSRLENMKKENIKIVHARADWSRNFPQLLRLLNRIVGLG